MRILLHRKNGGLGDMVCLLPALDALAAARPLDRVDVAVPADYAPLFAARAPNLHVIAAGHRTFRHRWLRLMARTADLAIDLSGPSLAHGEREPNRIEYFARVCGVRPASFRPAYRVPHPDAEWARAWLAGHAIDPAARPLVCLHTRSARARKDWPIARFRELAARLAERRCHVLAIERTHALAVTGAADATGLPLHQAAALIAAADVLVGPDSGPMHLAAAIGTPTIALFGPTDPDVILKHYRTTHRAIRRGTSLDSITVDEVFDAVLDVLRGGDRGARAVRISSPPAPRAAPPRPPSVLFISDKLFPATLGGAEISMHLLLERLAADRGVRTAARQWRRHSAEPLADLIRSHDPDWVFTQLRVAPEVAAEAHRQHRRVAVFIHSLAEHVCGYHDDGLHVCVETGHRADPLTCSLDCRRWRSDLAAQREMFATADLVVCNSEYTRRVIARVFTDTPPLVVQYPLIPAPARPGPLRRRYLTLIRPTVGKGGRLLAPLLGLLPGHEFLVVGDPPKVPSGARRRVAVLPAAPNIDEVYRSTRVLLQPAINVECFGRTVAEAAAFGVPAVVSGQGGLPEALGSGGIAVRDFESPPAWANAVRAIERDYDRFAALALAHAASFRSVNPRLTKALSSRLRCPAATALCRRGNRPVAPTSGRNAHVFSLNPAQSARACATRCFRSLL